ncbi:LysR family transcriptional regulator [Gynuella sunshinyii]|uniref:Transcriptional regulator n=1 Tax=Gynuella sunshinyii YC6258 TaxID=1445510 RepID=A0A0C5VV09_9GAMM|nr:LysR family transcriptional regulator [Gynuella sunshinyii]AJQ94219.1 transcriptional regulator [Gynuella sunshinyii YC6258]
MRLNLHLLRIFHAVVEHGSFSLAAEKLAISQPAVSKGVRELENQLDLALLERRSDAAKGPRRIQLTDSGQALFEHARGIFALERVAIEDIQARIGQQRGQLTIGASTTVASYWLPPVIAVLLQQHPDIDVRVFSGNTQTVAQALLECRVDVALVEGQVNERGIKASHWQDEPLQLVMPVAWEQALKQSGPNALRKKTWLVREPGSGTRDVIQQVLQNHGLATVNYLEIGSNEGIARCVAEGLGVSILPTSVIQELVELRKIAVWQDVWDTPLFRPLFLLQLEERPVSPLVNALYEILAGS